MIVFIIMDTIQSDFKFKKKTLFEDHKLNCTVCIEMNLNNPEDCTIIDNRDKTDFYKSSVTSNIGKIGKIKFILDKSESIPEIKKDIITKKPKITAKVTLAGCNDWSERS